MRFPLFFSTVSFFAVSFAIAIAQDEPTPTTATGEERIVIETKEKDSPANKGLKLEKEYRPRLPNGFGPTGVNVDAAQRDSIYKILTEYRELIDMLKLRVELLEKERDAKIDAVLTPTQQQRLNRPVRRPLLLTR